MVRYRGYKEKYVGLPMGCGGVGVQGRVSRGPIKPSNTERHSACALTRSENSSKLNNFVSFLFYLPQTRISYWLVER